VVAFVTNHVFLTGVTHRAMRKHLLDSFDSIYVLDLHGNSKNQEAAPDGSEDRNVFDIQQGVCITIFVKRLSKNEKCKVFHYDLWGKREAKYDYLLKHDVTNVPWMELPDVYQSSCLGTFYFFAPIGFDNIKEYCEAFPIQEVFPIFSNGIETHRDDFTVHWTKKDLENVIGDLKTKSVEDIRTKYSLEKDGQEWTLSGAKKSAAKYSGPESISPLQYRPFDSRFTFLNEEVRGFLARPRYEVMQHMLRPNVGLVLARLMSRAGSYDPVFVSTEITEKKAGDSTRSSSLFPLYIYKKDDKGQASLLEGNSAERTPNLAPAFIEETAKRLKLVFVADGAGDLIQTFGPEDILHYAYAVFHAPSYRSRYEAFLKIDFPRLPMTSDKSLFISLCKLGKKLVQTHLLIDVGSPKSTYPVAGSNKVEEVSRPEGAGDIVYINGTQYFTGLSDAVWNYHIGGYQVASKWLKDRKHRLLTHDDCTRYMKIITSIHRTMALEKDIDALSTHWPLA
jgi:predicted helicase